MRKHFESLQQCSEYWHQQHIHQTSCISENMVFGGVGVLLCWLISMTENRLPIQHAIFHHINTKYSQLFLSLICAVEITKIHGSCCLTSLYTWINVCSFKQTVSVRYVYKGKDIFLRLHPDVSILDTLRPLKKYPDLRGIITFGMNLH